MKAAGQVLEDMADKAAIPPEKRQEALKFAASAYNWANENFWPYSSYLSFANAVMNFGLVRGFIHPLVTR
jgi:hypothetical protein